jgi:hypothetical protein
MRLLISILIGVPIALLLAAIVYFVMVIGWVLVIGCVVIFVVMIIYTGLQNVPEKKKSP